MAPLKVGVLSTANIARKICRALTFTDCAEVVAVGSRDKAKAERFCAECGVGQAVAYGSYQDVLGDPAVEAVYIPLPTGLHLEWVRKAAAAGKHIMLEKPIALTPEETDAIVDACQQAGVQLMDGTMWTHSPRTALMSEVLRDKARMGELKAVNTNFSFFGNEEFLRSNVRVQSGLDALGALGDLGWYCCRAILWAFDYDVPTGVIAHGGSVFNEAGVPIHMGATVLFSGGRRGEFTCSFDRALRQYLEVAGTLGTVRLDDYVIPQEEKKCGFLVTFNHGLRNLDTYDGTESEEKIVYLEKPQEVRQWEVFAACVERIRGGQPPDAWWARIAALTQHVVCAVLESARAGGKEVPVRFAA